MTDTTRTALSKVTDKAPTTDPREWSAAATRFRDAHNATVARMQDRSISPTQHWPIFAEEVARLALPHLPVPTPAETGLDVLWHRVFTLAEHKWCGEKGHISKAAILALIEDLQKEI